MERRRIWGEPRADSGIIERDRRGSRQRVADDAQKYQKSIGWLPGCEEKAQEYSGRRRKFTRVPGVTIVQRSLSCINTIPHILPSK